MLKLLVLCYMMCFQNVGKKAANNVTRDFRVWPYKSQIVKLTKDTVQQYDEFCGVQKPSCELQAYVFTVIIKTFAFPRITASNLIMAGS